MWTVPATRMKAKHAHRVSLDRRGTQILDEARMLGGGGSIVFTRGHGRQLAETQLSQSLSKLGIVAVPHGFRSSFRDWLAEETDHPHEVIEAALAHVVRNKVEAPNWRTDLFERRRRLKENRAAYLAGGEDPEAKPIH